MISRATASAGRGPTRLPPRAPARTAALKMAILRTRINNPPSVRRATARPESPTLARTDTGQVRILLQKNAERSNSLFTVNVERLRRQGVALRTDYIRGTFGLEPERGARHGRRPLRIDAGGCVASTLIANPRPAIVSASAVGAQQAAPLRGGYAL